MKILVATEKPFAAVAVEGIRKEVEQAGHELVLLEKGTKDDLVKAVADVDGLIVRSDIVDTTVLDAAKKSESDCARRSRSRQYRPPSS